MKRILTLVSAIITINGFCQITTGWCPTHEMEQQYLIDHPNEAAQILQDKAELKAFTKEFIANGARTLGQNYIIPVVFHILHQNGPENISDLKVHEQLARLNADYNGYNSDTGSVAPTFKPIIGNANIQFVLAKKDPTGNPTTGIVRYNTPDTEAFYSGQAANGRIWPNDMYMNFFVVKCLNASSCANTSAGGVMAYTYTPGGTLPSTDAIYARYITVNGSGRTLTHEIGHWFNLQHTWGPSNNPGSVNNCTVDDGVADTPNTEGKLGSCDLTQVTCGSLDNVDNYMDYTSCKRMFTQGQTDRVRAALESPVGGRNNLWTEANLIATGIIDCYAANFLHTKVVCSGADVKFYDQSILFNKNAWSWSFPGGSPSNSAEVNPTVNYTVPGLYNITLNVSNADTTMAKTMQILISDPLNNYPSITESFETTTAIPNSKWMSLNEQEDVYKFDITTDAAYTGTTSIKMNNYGNTSGNIDEFVSSSIDLSPLQSVSITFKLAYAAQTNPSLDKFRAYISNDCGQTWGIRLSQTGAILSSAPATDNSFVPTDSTQWKEYSIGGISSPYLIEDFMFKFVFESDSGNNLYIDDINITGVWDTKPVLHLPMDLQTGVPDNEIINWKSVDGVDSYEWELDTTNLFSSSLLQSGATTFISVNPNGSDTEFETSNLLWSQQYFWRVRTVTGGVASNWSDVWEFTVAADGVGFDALNTNDKSFSIYPNPTANRFVIQNINSGDIIKVYNLLGEVIYTSTANNNLHSVGVSKWNKGIYIVSVGQSIQKVIVQ